MDDTTRLASELIAMLKELNHKVCDYRRGLAQEFHRHSHHLLQDVPADISTRVEELIAEELHNYPALGPVFALDTGLADLGDFAPNRWSPSGRVSPTPALPHTAADPSSPTERGRDSELHGLFTPSYLPLLEVMQSDITTTSSIAVSSPAPPQDTDSNDDQANDDQATDDQTNDDQEPLPPVKPRNIPLQLNTVIFPSELTSPATASPEDNQLHRRRSALRRSSSTSTRDFMSPRRVRFDVAGEEVLPTVSPPTPAQVHPLPISPPPEFETMPIHQPLNRIILEEETSILGDSPPRPKKISSTEKLRALARSSTEDVSKWTVVGNLQDDDDDEEEGLIMFRPKGKSKTPAAEVAATILKNGIGSHSAQVPQSTDQSEDTDNGQTIDKNEAAHNLFGPPLTFNNEKRLFSHEAMADINPKEGQPRHMHSGKAKSSDYAIMPQSHETSNFEEDMFGFDEEWGSPPQAAEMAPKYIQGELEIEEETTPFADDPAEGSSGGLSKPLGITIARPAIPPPASPAPSFSKPLGASGSYKGKPFVIGVVRDEELYKKAAEMGNIGMFVGSVDGRSGVDPSDNYHFGGSPKSVGKRLLEEAQLRRNKKNTDKPEK
ncbi:hypothetical protein GGS21DRAFT_486700 [Xylaria nigripes]|nr:hypothetical protein GGS21DRAFT_486700 [Xylaria nigripes]